jgi:hypothetical protein
MMIPVTVPGIAAAPRDGLADLFVLAGAGLLEPLLLHGILFRNQRAEPRSALGLFLLLALAVGLVLGRGRGLLLGQRLLARLGLARLEDL